MTDANIIFCCANRDAEYRITKRDGDLCFETRRASSTTWSPLSMRRTIRSAIHMLGADWPPQQVDALSIAAERLQLRFSDVSIFGGERLRERWREARWLATLVGQRWSVRRINYIESLEQYRARISTQR